MIGRRLSINEWLAYITAYPLPASCTRLVLHHTYIPTQAQWQGITTLRGIQRFYAGKGWTAAPHLFVAPDGIWLFTPLNRVGIHAGTGNSGYSSGVFWYSIGVEMVGNFDGSRPSGAVWEGAKAVMGGVSRRNRVVPRQLISIHRDYTNQKSCPGWSVTKDWIWGEVDAWLAGRPAPTPPPPGPIGTPTPSNERVLETLMNETYTRRAEGYNSDWAFHQVAVQRGLGAPLARTNEINADGKNWKFQVFARDTLFCEIPNWGEVRLLSETMAGSIPPTGLARGLLEASFLAGGAPFDINEIFHQFAFAARLGPPMGPITTLVSDGMSYRVAPFAVDTLYAPTNDPGNIQQLSFLANTADARLGRLRDTILAELYRRAGTGYHPEWAFHQAARTYNIGAPLSGDYKVRLDTTDYNLQVYALDTLYNIVPNWGDVRRLSSLSQTTIRSSARSSQPGVQPDAQKAQTQLPYKPNARLEPPTNQPYQIVQFAPESPASTPRSGARILLIVLHGDAGPAAQSLERMTSLTAEDSTHYYIDSKGAILQLVSDERAAWHSGLGEWGGRRQNINRISIGVTLEHRKGQSYDAQIGPLRWLLATLRARYDLPPNTVVPWSNFLGRTPLVPPSTALDGLKL